MTKPQRMTRFGALALAISTSTSIGCQRDDSPQDDHAEETGDGDGEPLLTTYWQDVAPIYYERCVECHRAGGIGPFVLDEYSSAAAWGPASALAVEHRTMPPWLVTDDGSCNAWQHSRALDQAEIDTILAWVEDGVPEGQPRDDLQVPELPGLDGGTPFVTPEFWPAPQGGIFAEHDEYRCFLLDPQLEQDMFITGYEVVPGNEALVHHVLGVPVDPDLQVGDGLTNLEVITALDQQSPDRLGWPCFGVAGDGVIPEGIPISWAPGQGVVELPAGSGSRLAAGHLLVVQVHYNMINPELLGQSDSTTVNIRLAPEVAREGVFDIPDGLLATMFGGSPHALAPGQAEETFTWSFPVEWYTEWLGGNTVELWGFFPHMHERGTSMKARVLDEHGAEVGCVADVPRWDFGWQLYYFYEQPIILEHGQQIEVTCTYDTSGDEQAIWPGWGTHNEMCLTGLYIVG
jgi:mono/diheme cytochrome c family protein